MTVFDIRDVVGINIEFILYDRKNNNESVFSGLNLNMPTFWDNRKVVWVCPYNQALYIDIE